MYPPSARFHSLRLAMVMMILWQVAGSRISSAKNKWWLDMKIRTQLLCEQAIRHSDRGDSKIYSYYEDQVMYCIDLVSMTQQNLRSGTTRQLRRLEVINFSIRGGYIQEYAAPELSCTQLREAPRNWKEQKWKAALEPARKSSPRHRR